MNESHKPDNLKGALRSDERILIAPVARMHQSAISRLKSSEDSFSDPLLASPHGTGTNQNQLKIVI